jgi:hypothetical protein
LKDVTANFDAEDKIVAQFRPGVGVPEYRYLTFADSSRKALEQRLKKDGFDAVIVMRLKSVEKNATYVPPTYTYANAYGGWYDYRGYCPGYYSPGYYSPNYYATGYYATGIYSPETYTPGYFKDNETFIVETNFYSITETKLLWSATTTTLNPTKLDEALGQIIRAIKTQLRKEGVIKK